jgi:serine/threonine-protein kinase
MPTVRRVDRYVVFEDPLARGGMATVFLGRLVGHSGFARTVAIKRMHQHLADQSEFVKAFVDEAKLAARIKHPNVVPTLDVVSSDDDLLLVMEHVHGLSLSVVLRTAVERKIEVPLPVAVGIGAGMLHGLHAAHEAVDEDGSPLHIVHRDVSPQNVLVGADGVARVLDFGIAKAARRLAAETESGVVKGKLAYMAPEQFMDEEVTRLADVYAAGVVVWELLAQTPMFRTPNGTRGVYEPMDTMIDPPSAFREGLPPELDAAVLRALARDPKRRFPTARDFAVAIERAVPPATPTTIAEWLQEACGELLKTHAARVREIESTSIDRSVPVDTASVPTVENALTDMTFAEVPTKPRTRRWWVAIGGAIAIAAVVPAAAMLRSRPPPSAPPVVLAPASEAAPPAPATAIVTASATASASASTRVVTTPPKSSRPSRGKAADDPCKPPYWIDSDNVRHPKLECM